MIRRSLIVCLAVVSCGLGACSDPSGPNGETPDAGTANDLGTGGDAAMDMDQGVPDVADLASDAADSSDVQDLPGDAGAADMPDTADVSDSGMDAEVDAGPCIPPPTTPAPLVQLPTVLSQTGLYDDIATDTFADGVRPFQPRYVLWSDGAQKDRFLWLPPCEKIDNTDQDFWSYPVGTRVWKTFTRDGVRIETRLITRWGAGPKDFHMATYVWRDDGTDADLVELGLMNAKGTEHDVPAVDQCMSCHGHLPEPILGLGAIMLTHQLPGLSIEDLSNEGWLSVPAPNGFEIPGDPVVRDALGYLHANCSNCHNDTPDAIQFTTPFSLRSHTTETLPEQTGPYRTAVGVFVTRFISTECVTRVLAGDPSGSCVFVRMSTRGNTDQMPATGTELVHPEGLQVISDWISGL